MHAYSNVGTVECVGLSLGNALLFASYDSSFVMSSAYRKYSLYLALFYTVFVCVFVCVCVPVVLDGYRSANFSAVPI